MSKLHNVIVGLAALAVALGAVQIASGSDLIVPQRGSSQTESRPVGDIVNREGKADRGLFAGTLAPSNTTFSIYAGNASGTYVLVRVPGVVTPLETARGSSQPAALRPARDLMTACEPVVSVLTAVARTLPPGRCVT
jgi:hypothetical protein